MYFKVLVSSICLLVLFAVSAKAQLSIGGKPASFGKFIAGKIESKKLSPVNVAAFLAEDMQQAGKDIPFRFGAPVDVSYNMHNSGSWSSLSDGSQIWRLEIISEGAYSLNLLYDEFYLPEGSRLFLYSSDQSYVLGAFTSANNKTHRKFSTAPTSGDKVILEYHQPVSVTETAVIKISRVVHAYRNIFDRSITGKVSGFGDAGFCNNNVNCPEGDDWRDQIRSVTMILTGGGSRLCSGSMINNVRADGTPYFLTANHCLGGESSWIFLFNYQSLTCANINGPTNMTVQGSTRLANFSTSDFALLLLDDTPPDSFNIYYSGWSAEVSSGDSSVGIHHPSGDIKKITFDYDSVTATSWLGTTPGTTHWRVGNWEDGTTEPGSSGSPLFDKNKRIIGQLHGGFASCASITADWYGSVARSWLGGGSSSSSLKPWLDPDNSGLLVLDGYAPLIIRHARLGDTEDTLISYEVVATITSSYTLLTDSLLLFYQIDSVPFVDTLTPTGNADEYHGFIPAQKAGSFIEYFIFAQNDRGDFSTSILYTFSILEPPFVCGDVDNNGEFQGILELTYLVDYIFRSGPAPENEFAADINGSGGIANILDLTYIVDFVFRSGPPPVCQ